MAADTGDVAGVATTGFQIRLIAIKRFTQRRRLFGGVAVLGRGASFRLLLRLPIIEDRIAVRLIVIVGEPIASVQLPPFPSATRTTHVPAV